MKRVAHIFAFFVLAFLFSSTVHAATLNIITDADAYPLGKEFIIDIKIDSEAQGINGVQATLQFDKNIFEAVRVDKANSVFDFWLTEPTIVNDVGQIAFIAAGTKGSSGKSLEVFRVTFKPKESGKGTILFSDAAITAADGSGTNVLTKLNGVELNILAVQEITKAKITAPTQIVRVAERASSSPLLPNISIPLYPDSTKWNNASSRFFVNWKLPPDITDVALVLDKMPMTIPTISEGLFESKEFAPLADGIYYLHARFKNSTGWGKTLHYRIAVDTAPPLPFNIQIQNTPPDNPSPKVTLNAHDALSGILHAVLFVDNREVLTMGTTSTALPTTPPGKHVLRVRIIDLAGNSVEERSAFEILPLPLPIVGFLSSAVTLEDPVFATGKSLPNTFVDAYVMSAEQEEVFTASTQTDGSGNWKISIDKILHTGEYMFSVVARDERGALSNQTPHQTFAVKPKTVLSFSGIIDLGWFEIFLLSVFIILSAVGVRGWWYITQKRKREAYSVVVGRDVDNLTTNFSEDIKKTEGVLDESPEGLTPKSRAELHMYLEKLLANSAKMKKYIGEEVKKMK